MGKGAVISLFALLAPIVAASAADRADQIFIENAIRSNLSEIQLGQLAQEKAKSDNVRSYGKMLFTDHSAANDQAKKVADQIGMTPPGEPSAKQAAVYDRMVKLAGAEFDRAFVKEMVADHKNDISEYEQESKKRNDPVADYARQRVPTLQRHLNAAEKLERSTRSSR